MILISKSIVGLIFLLQLKKAKISLISSSRFFLELGLAGRDPLWPFSKLPMRCNSTARNQQHRYARLLPRV